MGSGMRPGRHLCYLVFCREIGTPISGSRLVYGNQALGVKHLNSWVTFLNKLAYHSRRNGNYGFSYELRFSLYCCTQGRCSSKLLPGGSTQLIGLLQVYFSWKNPARRTPLIYMFSLLFCPYQIPPKPFLEFFRPLLVWFLRDEAAEREELIQHTMGCRKGKSVCMSLRRKELGNESCRCCVIVSLCEMEFVCGCEKGVLGSEQAWA